MSAIDVDDLNYRSSPSPCSELQLSELEEVIFTVTGEDSASDSP